MDERRMVKEYKKEVVERNVNGRQNFEKQRSTKNIKQSKDGGLTELERRLNRGGAEVELRQNRGRPEVEKKLNRGRAEVEKG